MTDNIDPVVLERVRQAIKRQWLDDEAELGKASDENMARAAIKAVGGGGSTMSRELLGRWVRQAWVAWASEQDSPKASWLSPWEDLDEGQRKVDMCIGEALYEAGRRAENPALVFGGGGITETPETEWVPKVGDKVTGTETLGWPQQDVVGWFHSSGVDGLSWLKIHQDDSETAQRYLVATASMRPAPALDGSVVPTGSTEDPGTFLDGNDTEWTRTEDGDYTALDGTMSGWSLVEIKRNFGSAVSSSDGEKPAPEPRQRGHLVAVPVDNHWEGGCLGCQWTAIGGGEQIVRGMYDLHDCDDYPPAAVPVGEETP